MLRETVELLIETAQKAKGVVRLGETHDGKTELFSVHGDLVPLPVPPSPRFHTFRTLEDLTAFICRWIEGGGSGEASILCHDVECVTFVFDAGDRRDCAQFPLTFSPVFWLLQGLDRETKLWEQRAFIAFCVQKLNLAKAVVLPFRRLDWKTYGLVSGEVNHGGDRMGREVAASVGGASELPEVLAVPARVYSQAGELTEVTIACHVQLLPADQRIALVPFVGACDAAIEVAQRSIRERLEEGVPESVGVYFGTP